MNEKFFSLSIKKQQRIINAAMEVFAKNDYKGASTDLIAAKADISKGLLFYYFHNKKELYLYVYNYLVEVMKEQVADTRITGLTDFFEILRYATTKKVSLLQTNPYVIEFAMRAFYSEGEDVSREINRENTMLEDQLYTVYFSHIDQFKFKDDVDPYRIYKMLVWIADGYIHDLTKAEKDWNLDELVAEFEGWTDMMRMIVYKEEYQR